MEDSGGAPDNTPVLAIDVGGTKMAAALVEPGGRVGAYERIVTPRPPRVDADGLWRTLLALIDKLPIQRLAGIGVGCGGPMWWPSGAVSPHKMPAWRAFPLRERLSELFPGLPVRVHNDAVAMTVGEHWRGAGRNRAAWRRSPAVRDCRRGPASRGGRGRRDRSWPTTRPAGTRWPYAP
jgi:glucokinase